MAGAKQLQECGRDGAICKMKSVRYSDFVNYSDVKKDDIAIPTICDGIRKGFVAPSSPAVFGKLRFESGSSSNRLNLLTFATKSLG